MHSWRGMVQPENLLEVNEHSPFCLKYVVLFFCSFWENQNRNTPLEDFQTFILVNCFFLYYDSDLGLNFYLYSCRICCNSWMAAPQIIMSLYLINDLEEVLRYQFLKYNVCPVFSFHFSVFLVLCMMLHLMLQQERKLTVKCLKKLADYIYLVHMY